MKPDQESIAAPQEIKLKRLLQYFNRNTHNSQSEGSKPDSSKSERRFCFIIGSGASVPSGIPTGGALVRRWVEELRKEFEETELNTWFKQIGYQEEKAAEFYPQVYEKKFEIDPDEGYDELAQLMERKEPSCGYSVLVQILANTQHNVVITTNFDTLTEDAMFTYTDKRPLVCGHESLSGFIRPFTRRPIIAKIHRDLFFAPKNRRDDIDKLDDQWVNSLKNIFEYYTPIVIGYGGNDGSLMGFLEKLQLKGIFWCYREADGKPGKRILKLVEQHKGFIVPIEGFDEMMIQLNTQLGFALLDKQILEVAQQKADNYRKQIEAIQGRQQVGKDTKEALVKTIKSKEGTKTWWDYMLLIKAEKDRNKQEQIYQEGINTFPGSKELLHNYASLSFIHKDYDKAEHYYKKALEIDPNYTYALNGYGALCYEKLKDYDKAEQYYKKAFEIDPNYATALYNYAELLKDIRKDYDQAELYYKKVLEIDSNDTDALNDYANLLKDIRKDYDKAELYYRQAIESDQGHIKSLEDYATFLETIRKDPEKAKQYREKAEALKKQQNQSNT
jgi:tetratricopeptide (TPR) repeat protein